MLYTMPTDMMLRVQDILFLKEHVNVAIQGFTKIQGLKRQEKLKRVSVPFFVQVVFQVGSKLGQDPEKLPGVPLQIVHEGALGQDGGIVIERLEGEGLVVFRYVGGVAPCLFSSPGGTSATAVIDTNT